MGLTMKIYLSGGLNSDWQDELLPLLRGHEVIDPRCMLNIPDFARKELEEVITSDCVIGYFEKNNQSGQGLNAEIALARYHPSKKRLLILCAEKECFVSSLVDHLFSDFIKMQKHIKTHLMLESARCL